MEVEVACALPDRQRIVKLRLQTGSTVEEAIQASGLLTEFPGINLTNGAVGIFGRAVPMTQRLQSGDRVEIYRPLLSDPKQLRRQRAEKQVARRRIPVNKRR